VRLEQREHLVVRQRLGHATIAPDDPLGARGAPRHGVDSVVKVLGLARISSALRLA